MASCAPAACACKAACMAPCQDAAAAGPRLDTLPDAVVLAHLLPRLGAADKKVFRLTSPRQRQQTNQSVRTVSVPGAALAAAPDGATLGAPFPAARALKAFDSDDEPVTDERLMAFLSASPAWLAALAEVDLKECHHVTARLLGWLAAACPKLRKLAPSRWTDHGSLRGIAAFPCLEELDLGDPDSDIITVDDLGLCGLVGLARSLRVLGLSRCRWVSDAAFPTLAALAGLESLDLSHTDVGPRGLAALAGLTNLRTLNLTGCRCVTDEALVALAAIPSLSQLSLKGTLATNAGLSALAALPRLSALDLGSKWELDDEGLAAVAACPELRVLSAGSFNLVRPRANPRGLQKLEHLSFGGGFANKGLALLFPLLRLRSLHVQGIDSVTDAVMRHISGSQTALQQLSLRSGYSLTRGGLALLAPLANLAVLSVGACPAISRAWLQEFAGGHARLAGLVEGACPLLADRDALCAVAPEPALAPFLQLPVVRVN
ncbi:FBXL14 [Scenedesmus sp. PABB004]|nr:FBXL14 [Scenedesmus sp. PABB004]